MANESYYEKRKRILREQKKRQESRKMTGGLGDANASANTIQKAKVRLKDSMKQPKTKTVDKFKPKKTVSTKMKDMYTKNYKTKLDKKVKEEVAKANKSGKTKSMKAESTFKDLKKTASDKIAKNKKLTRKDNTIPEKMSATMTKIKKKSEKKPKKVIVTKEQLKKSGLSLRDYMNMLQGKTRRDYKDVKKAAQKKRAKRSST